MKCGDACEVVPINEKRLVRCPFPCNGSQINLIPFAYLYIRTGTSYSLQKGCLVPPSTFHCPVLTPCHRDVKKSDTQRFLPFFPPTVDPYCHHRSPPVRRSVRTAWLPGCFTTSTSRHRLLIVPMGHLLPTLELLRAAFRALAACAPFPSFAEI